MNKKTIDIVMAVPAGVAALAAGCCVGIGINRDTQPDCRQESVSWELSEEGWFNRAARILGSERFVRLRDSGRIDRLADDHYIKENFHIVRQFVENPDTTRLVGRLVQAGSESDHWRFEVANSRNSEISERSENFVTNWYAVIEFAREAEEYFGLA